LGRGPGLKNKNKNNEWANNSKYPSRTEPVERVQKKSIPTKKLKTNTKTKNKTKNQNQKNKTKTKTKTKN
jgi:hypothetical protein